MYVNELKQALYLSSRYSVNNLKQRYKLILSNNVNEESNLKYSSLSLLDVISDFETTGLNDIKDKNIKEEIDIFNSLGTPINNRIERLINYGYRYHDIITYMHKDAKTKETFDKSVEYKSKKLGLIRYKKKSKKPFTLQKYVRLIKELESLSPDKSFPLSYKIIYHKTILQVLINLFNQNISTPMHLESTKWLCILFLNSKLTQYGFIKIIIDIILADSFDKNLISLATKIRKCKSEIKSQLKSYANKEKLSNEDIDLIMFYGQVLTFLVCIEKKETNIAQDILEKEAVSYLAYFLSEIYLQGSSPDPITGLQFAKKGLIVSNPLNCQDAFNILGLCALDCGYLQLSYDIYYSWLNSCIVGELRDLLPNNYHFPSNDVDNKAKAVMHNNFSYVCSTISNSYDYKYNSVEWNAFHEIAIDEIKKAIKLNPSDPSYHKNYAIMLCDGRESDENLFNSLEHYFNYKEKAVTTGSTEDIIDATRLCSESILDYILNKYSIDADYLNWFQGKTIQKYYSELDASIINYRTLGTKNILLQSQLENDYATRILWKPIFNLQEKFEDYKDVKHIKLLLLLLHRTSLNLKKSLKRTVYASKNYYTRIKENDKKFKPLSQEIETIAYYSKLSTTKYLFEELYQDTSDLLPRIAELNEPGKNCLTIMNAKYMNDPHEGLTLLNSLFSIARDSRHEHPLFHNYPTEKFREDIYNNYFIFLKSFTENIDDLIMWNRYASDYNDEGYDSNGCYIQLDSDVFQQLMNPSSSESLSIITNDDLQDDYGLYRVVYVDKNGTAQREVNPKISDDALLYYDKLRSLFAVLNKNLNDDNIRNSIGTKWETFLNDIRSFLQHSLQFIIFLVKDEAYSEERESRLILTRSFDQQGTIRLLDGTPSKLCINPYFQIYITRIIFGPNVHNPSLWVPYFQYHLNKMWEKHPDYQYTVSKDSTSKYIIENSRVPYKTN